MATPWPWRNRHCSTRMFSLEMFICRPLQFCAREERANEWILRLGCFSSSEIQVEGERASANEPIPESRATPSRRPDESQHTETETANAETTRARIVTNLRTRPYLARFDGDAVVPGVDRAVPNVHVRGRIRVDAVRVLFKRKTATLTGRSTVEEGQPRNAEHGRTGASCRGLRAASPEHGNTLHVEHTGSGRGVGGPLDSRASWRGRKCPGR